MSVERRRGRRCRASEAAAVPNVAADHRNSCNGALIFGGGTTPKASTSPAVCRSARADSHQVTMRDGLTAEPDIAKRRCQASNVAADERRERYMRDKRSFPYHPSTPSPSLPNAWARMQRRASLAAAWSAASGASNPEIAWTWTREQPTAFDSFQPARNAVNGA